MDSFMSVKAVEQKDVNCGQMMSTKASEFSIDSIIRKRNFQQVGQVLSRSPCREIESLGQAEIELESAGKIPKWCISITNNFVSIGKKYRPSPLSAISCSLETTELWEKFAKAGTEMIITRSGRRMFPGIRVSVSGLLPNTEYVVVMDLVPLDDKRYRYAYHQSSWLVAGKADPGSVCRGYLHPDSLSSWKNASKQTVSFEKVKLTNNIVNRHGYILLKSMHKYQPRIHILLRDSLKNFPDLDNIVMGDIPKGHYETFTFPETVFVAVTAYQNQLITKLKIDCNPFAKGFRDSSKLTDFERESLQKSSWPTEIIPSSEESTDTIHSEYPNLLINQNTISEDTVHRNVCHYSQNSFFSENNTSHKSDFYSPNSSLSPFIKRNLLRSYLFPNFCYRIVQHFTHPRQIISRSRYCPDYYQNKPKIPMCLNGMFCQVPRRNEKERSDLMSISYSERERTILRTSASCLK